LPLPSFAKFGSVILCLGYVVYISYKHKYFAFKELLNFEDTSWKLILSRFLLLGILLTALMYTLKPELMFTMIKQRPDIWILFVLIYSFLSVIPQELIYRSYFFLRYKRILKDGFAAIIINAFIFSFAHIILLNWWVLALTFVGGLLFAATYKKSNSIIATSIEHALYGSWLFTLGIGEMLAFPGVDQFNG
jgi:membrane protease YdiL (CAAX protease family)